MYYAMTANLDDNIGRLKEAVSRLGLEDNSIIVFTSDHGELFGAHGRRAKNIFYEEAVRVPMLIRWPGHLEEHVRRDCVMNTVDIMPTLLSLMDLPVPLGVEGKDFSMAVKGEEVRDDGALMMCTGPTAAWGDGQEWRAFRTRRYKYAVYRSDQQEFLFDLENDPYERINLAGDLEYRDRLEDLKRQMYSRMEAVGDHFESNTYYRDHWVEDRIIRHTATI